MFLKKASNYTSIGVLGLVAIDLSIESLRKGSRQAKSQEFSMRLKCGSLALFILSTLTLPAVYTNSIPKYTFLAEIVALCMLRKHPVLKPIMSVKNIGDIFNPMLSTLGKIFENPRSLGSVIYEDLSKESVLTYPLKVYVAYSLCRNPENKAVSFQRMAAILVPVVPLIVTTCLLTKEVLYKSYAAALFCLRFIPVKG